MNHQSFQVCRINLNSFKYEKVDRASVIYRDVIKFEQCSMRWFYMAVDMIFLGMCFESYVGRSLFVLKSPKSLQLR